MEVAIIGLGYVGLPLAVEFGKQITTKGFDINPKRVEELNKGYDSTLEISSEDLINVLKDGKLIITNEVDKIRQSNIFIITVPTPIDKFNNPDLTYLQSASKLVGSVLKKGDIVIYESTVYPGCTEEDCVPILQQVSGLLYNVDFFCGYSPERINPGDKNHTVTKIKKITSGSTPEIADMVDNLYKMIIKAGTHKTSSIKIAEAAKVIENSQRDINIAFVNELALIFKRINISTQEVLAAASTKWNFLPFTPGLVGGHCIGVDPFYLTHKAQSLGYQSKIILAGRNLNDSMGHFIANQTIKLLIKKGNAILGAKILVLGITFKENCPDVRNSRVIDIISEMKEFGADVSVYDPWADPYIVNQEFEIQLIDEIKEGYYDGIIIAVGHIQFQELDLQKIKKTNTVVYDVKSIMKPSLVDEQL